MIWRPPDLIFGFRVELQVIYHFYIYYVNGKEVCTSQRKTREPPPRWKEQKRLIVIFRQSLLAKRFPVKKYIVAEFNGKGVDLLDNSTEHEMRAESGDSVASRISVRLDYSSESHAEFMKAVDGDMSRIGVQGSDAAQTTMPIAGQLGTVLQKIVPIVDQFAGSHPVLNAAWTVLSAAYKVMQTQIAEDGAVRDLLESLREMAGVAGACPNLPEVGGTIDVIEEIGRTTLEAALLIHEYAGPSVRGKTSIFARTAKHSWTDMSSRVAQCQKQCKDLIAMFDRRLHLDTNLRVKGLQDTQTKIVLDKLAYAEGASWDPTMACLPGTRATILSIIHPWARSLDGRNVLWLKGVAGSGKSAIAHTIAQSLHKDGRLASSFFFNGNVASRNTSQLLVTTIARDIAMIHPAIAADIRMTLEEDPSLASASLSRQFEAFISGPLRRHPIERSFVIVIDALDEIIHEGSAMELLTILRDETFKLPPQLRILITSRPTRDIIDYLSKKSHIVSHVIDIASVESGLDIEAYIGHQLRDEILHKRMGSPHSTKVLIRDLTNLAEGLFIWIVTVFRYLRNADNPEGKLRALLSKTATPGRLDPSKIMDALYTVILEICGDWQDPEFCEGYRMLMGAIMSAKRPLSLAALRALHGGTLMLSPGIFGVSEQLLYCCEYWSDHVSDVDEPDAAIAKAVQGFLLRHNIMWIEIVSSMSVFRGSLAVWRWLQVRAPEFKDQSDESQASILLSLSRRFKYAGRLEEALLASQDTVDLGRALVAEQPAAFNSHLASFLNELSMHLSALGLHDEALAANEEALDLYRALAAERPAVFNVDLARSLSNLSMYLSALGRHEEAVAETKEALDLYRALAAERPAVFNADFARSLSNLSMYLSALGRHEEAAAETREALDLYRALAAERPVVFDGDLAWSLGNLSMYLSALGWHEEAVAETKEALHLYRALAAGRPVVFNPDLARSLSNLSAYLPALGRHEEAVAVIKEALDLYRALAAERPAVFNVELARSLFNLSMYLSALGRHEEAVAETKEAVYLYRVLAAERPAVFNADLARCLSNLSMYLSALGWHEEALAETKGALDLFRVLAVERPATFNTNLTGSLNTLSCHLLDLNRHEEALVAITEALYIYRTLAEERTSAFNFDLACYLDTLSTCLSHLGRGEEALAAVQEAVDLCRALGPDSERPAGFNQSLYLFLINLSARLSYLCRWQDGLTAIHEAADFRRALAAEPPAVPDVELAKSVEQYSTFLLKAGHKEEARLILLELSELKML
ncbi:TPR-like protein [Athelia psychrophila]|uniref:TPR-like protein n=1 Tax=Athelia psychrophila TaxID=1759441 RepID=A0A166DHC3_9AGAM|nr:TPR-like protein [Fibularhizoctonia sp. CBS 109695]